MRCRRCGNDFHEENGWQEFCSRQCAREYIGTKEWDSWIADPKNQKKVRDAEPAAKPTFGVHVTITVNGQPVQYNIGGLIAVRPMTADEAMLALRRRGRETFGADVAENQGFRTRLPSENGHVGLAWYPHD